MSKLLPSISGVACFLWVSGWTWIFSEGKQVTTVGSNHTPINIFIDSLQYQVQHPFAFEYSEATPIISESLHPALKTVAKKIENQPTCKLKIVGVYSHFEDNLTSFPNLGVARAEAIKSLLVASGALSELIETVGLEADNLFLVDEKLTGVIYLSFSKQNVEYQAVAAEDARDVSKETASTVSSFYYNYGDYKVENHHRTFLKALQNELQRDAEKTVILTGYSTPEEEAESSRINLAEMRALSIRRYLVDHGVRRAQVEVKAKPSMAKSSSEMTVSIQVVKK